MGVVVRQMNSARGEVRQNGPPARIEGSQASHPRATEGIEDNGTGLGAGNDKGLNCSRRDFSRIGVDLIGVTALGRGTSRWDRSFCRTS